MAIEDMSNRNKNHLVNNGKNKKELHFSIGSAVFYLKKRPACLKAGFNMYNNIKRKNKEEGIFGN